MSDILCFDFQKKEAVAASQKKVATKAATKGDKAEKGGKRKSTAAKPKGRGGKKTKNQEPDEDEEEEDGEVLFFITKFNIISIFQSESFLSIFLHRFDYRIFEIPNISCFFTDDEISDTEGSVSYLLHFHHFLNDFQNIRIHFIALVSVQHKHFTL